MIESVLIPDDERLTLCISAQVGCKMNCDCMTGKMGFQDNLSVNEILNQVYHRQILKRLPILFLGNGRTLDNYENVMKSIEILSAEYGLHGAPDNYSFYYWGNTYVGAFF